MPIAMVLITIAVALAVARANCVEDQYSADIDSYMDLQPIVRGDLGGGYDRLRCRLPLNMLVVGDSIGDGTGSSSSANAWPALVCDYLSSEYGTQVEYTNVSMGGCSSLCGYVRVNALDDEKCYDLAVICYGENDSEENFGLYYESILRALRAQYPEIDIVCIQESSQREYTYKMQVIEEIAAHYGCPVVDTIAPFSNDYDNLVKDGIHPNDDGYKVYASEVENAIDDAVAQGMKTEEVIKPFDDNVMVFDNFVWIPKENFKRFENSYAINIIGDIKAVGTLSPVGSEAEPVVVVDKYDFEGSNRIIVSNNAQKIIDLQYEWPYVFKQRHIPVVSKGCEINEGTIRVTFDTNEQADTFEGIGFILGGL